MSSSGDRDKTAVGVSPPCRLEESGFCNNRFQVFSPTAAAIFIATGAGLFYYFNSEKESLKKQKGCALDIVSVRGLLMIRIRGRGRKQGLR